jgi:exonuclease VII small subunit
MPVSQDEHEMCSPGVSLGLSVQRETRTRNSPAPRDGANTSRSACAPRDLTQWAYNERMELIHHPQGCEMCTHYGTHISLAEISADTDYADAREHRMMHIQEDAYWRRTADSFDRQLSEAEEEIHRLQRKVDRLEQQLEDTSSYDRGCTGKRPCHQHSFESSNGPNRNATPASWMSLVPEAWAPNSYAQTAATRPAAQQDVDMTGPEEANYPPLPPPAPLMAMPLNIPTIPRGAQWTPAPAPRPKPWLTGRIISPTNKDELTELIRRAHDKRNMGAVLSMRIFARDAHSAGANCSPLQSLGLTRWRLPDWLPPDQRSPWATT